MPKAVTTILVTPHIVYDDTRYFTHIDYRGCILIGHRDDGDTTEIDTSKFHIVRVRNISQEEYMAYQRPDHHS